jgi:hypothetical protein
MADALKVLGQLFPSATTLTALYTVPAVTQTTASSIIICNQSSTPTTFRVSVAIAGAGDASQQYLYYDLAIAGNDTFIATIGISLATTDVINVYAGAATLSFNLFGVELT